MTRNIFNLEESLVPSREKKTNMIQEMFIVMHQRFVSEVGT